MAERLRERKAQADALVSAPDPERVEPPTPDEQSAAGAFLAAGPEVLAAATPHLWTYYRDELADWTAEDRLAWGVPDLADDADIWAEVELTFGTTEAGGSELAPAPAYVVLEGNVSWEPEHGLMVVLAEGVTVVKVGPFDGHVTNAHAFARPDLLDVVVVTRHDLG